MYIFIVCRNLPADALKKNRRNVLDKSYLGDCAEAKSDTRSGTNTGLVIVKQT